MSTVQMCPPHLSDVEIGKSKKSFFNIIIHILQIIYVSSEENKQQLLYCSFSCHLLLFSASYDLHSHIVLRLGHATGAARVLIRTC